MTTVAAAKPKVYQLRDFTLHVYGYTGDCFTLTELPGWPQSLKAVSPAEIGNHGGNESILIWFTNDERQFTLEDACEALTVLRENNLGYSASMTPTFDTQETQKIIYAWLLSAGGRPQVSKHGSREWVASTQGLLDAEVVRDYPDDFPRGREMERELNRRFKQSLKALQMTDLNAALGG